MTRPPLFLPLKAEHYEDFAAGTKRYELRKYGARWNEKVYTPGRGIILSRGYGKEHRMAGTVLEFRKRPATWFSKLDRATILSIYGSLEIDIAVIRIGALRALAQCPA